MWSRDVRGDHRRSGRKGGGGEGNKMHSNRIRRELERLVFLFLLLGRDPLGGGGVGLSLLGRGKDEGEGY